MYQVFAPILVIGTLLAASLAPAAKSPEPGSLTVTELLASPVGDVWRCGKCSSCGANKKEVADSNDNEYTNGVCQFTSSCNFPVCLSQEQEDGQEAKLTHEEMIRISDAVLSTRPEAALTALIRFPSNVRFVESRRSIQFLSCEGSIVANLPLTHEQFEAILAQQQEQ